MNEISTQVKNILIEKVEHLLNIKQKLITIYDNTKEELKKFNSLRDENKFYSVLSYKTYNDDTNFLKEVNYDCWRILLHNQEIKAILPKNRFEELINQSIFPDFNINIVISTLTQLYKDKDKYIVENIIYCFKILDKNYKTNSSYAFKDKSILNLASYRDYSGCSRSYSICNYYLNALISLESLFCNIDNINITNEESINILNYSYEKYVGNTLELKYFKLKVYKNGNVHIYYKDKEKLELLNKILQSHFGTTLAYGK